MRGLSALLIAVVLVCAGCTDDEPEPKPTQTTSLSTVDSISLETLGLGWPKAQGALAAKSPPATPDGFDDDLLDRMASLLETWAALSTVEDSIWHSEDAVGRIADAMPGVIGTSLRALAQNQVSPQLSVANVFADDVTVIGTPMVTTAWKVSTAKDDEGIPYVVLELQTRAAYEVRVKDGPSRVIGILRVHGLSAVPDATDVFGVSGGWQEFGANDCALALDDNLFPDSDSADALKDLGTFIKVGDGSKLVMPKLGVQEQVDEEYLKRCRDGSA
jgi:hypothetical protein